MKDIDQHWLRILRALAVYCALTASTGFAAGISPATDAELTALEQFLDLSDTELAQIEAAVVRIRSLTPEQRAELKERIIEYRRLPEPDRSALRMGWGWRNPEDREEWRIFVRSLSIEERAAIHDELQRLPTEERFERREALLREWRKRRPAP